MYRIYIGNLDRRVTEEELRNLFRQRSIEVTDILVKRGYAFADCEDQSTVDKAIDCLNGKHVTFNVQFYS